MIVIRKVDRGLRFDVLVLQTPSQLSDTRLPIPRATLHFRREGSLSFHLCNSYFLDTERAL